VHEVSVLDLLFNEGARGSARYLAAFRDRIQARFAAETQPQPPGACAPPPPGAGAARPPAARAQAGRTT
jgi:hypothetical protein